MPTNTTTEQRLLTVTAVAALVGVSAMTVRRWADAGHLPCRRLPTGARRFHGEDVEALLRSMDAAPVPA